MSVAVIKSPVAATTSTFGKVNEHNGWVPRDFSLEDWEKQAIIGFHRLSGQAIWARVGGVIRHASNLSLCRAGEVCFGVRSILSRDPLDAIDHQELDLHIPALQLQP
jgi:hypothetical protein